MIEKFPVLIKGATTSSGVLEVKNPYDLSKIGEIEAADAEAIEKALDTASSLYKNRDTWLSAARRIEILEKAAELLAERHEEYSLAAAREGGKPLLDSRVEVTRAIDGIKNCIEVLRTEGGKEIPMGVNASSVEKFAFTRKEPIGVVVAVSAFNHPVNLIIHQVFPAVATGCPVIVKPASDTPLACMRLVKLLHEAGLPEQWCQALVTKDRAAATNLVTDSRVAFFSFIGSGEVGWKLRSQLAPGARAALEHGGVAPVIVAKDADIKDAIPRLVKAGLYHAGQVCVSAQNIFVHSSLVDEFAKEFCAQSAKLKVGDPQEESTDIGPLIKPAETDRVEEWVNEAVEGGAEVLLGGKRLSDTTFEATVLLNPPADSRACKQEIFGPVVCIYSFDELDEAIDRANHPEFAFQASVFTNDLQTMLRCHSRIQASAIMINEHTAFRVDWMPFAGLKESGLAVGGIPYTMEDMQVDKMLVVRSPEIL